MLQPHCVSSRERVVDTMIELTRLSHQHRAIVAGSDSEALHLALRRRGFIRVATPATCRIARGQHTVGLITEQGAPAAIEAALAGISPFLCTNAAIAVLIDSRESGVCLKIRNRLEQMGFRIEAGVRCQQGLVLSAYRQGFGQMEKAA
jgi:DNA-binding LacI/PurR family transcriptional regulator